MFDLSGSLRRQLREAMTCRQTLIFPEGEDPRVINAASRLLKFAHIVLVGRKSQIQSVIQNNPKCLECSKKRFLSEVRFANPQDEPMTQHLAHQLWTLSQGKKWEMTLEQANRQILEPNYFAIMAVREGYADAVLGGLVYTSREFFSPCLRILDHADTVYEMGLFALPDEHPDGIYEQKLVMFADVALTPEPTAEKLADIAVGACKTMRDIIPPKVLPEINGALLSYSTRGSGQGPSVERVRKAEPLIQEKLKALVRENPIYKDIHIVTEMQISVAISEAAARTKLKDEYKYLKGAGRANVLIVPSLDVGNLLYHIYATRYPHAISTLIIGGFYDQALDFSRSSTSDDLVNGAKALLLRRFKSGRSTCTPKDDFFPRYRILAINPGSTSTKVALFEGGAEIDRQTYKHSVEALSSKILDQFQMRLEVVLEFLKKNQRTVEELDAIVGRGGLLPPMLGGTYEINEALLYDLQYRVSGEHPSNLGGLIAHELAQRGGSIPSYIVDPPVVDELDALSKITGLKGIVQDVAWHALSQKAVAKHFCYSRNLDYEDLNLIVGHLGGGISIGAHRNGKCVKVKNALFDGPMTPNRSGTLPGSGWIQLVQQNLSSSELKRRLTKEGGLISYLGTDDLREVEAMIQSGNTQAALIFEAMIEQIASEIASMIPKFKGQKVHRIILTGGMCHAQRLCQGLLRDLGALGIKITVYPGEREMEALRDGVLRVLRGAEEAKIYTRTL